MAALDDIVGVAVFFTVIAIVARHVSGGAMEMYMIPVMIFLPLIIGAAVGVPAAFLMKNAAMSSCQWALSSQEFC